jgi:hypothetical protein
MIRMGRVWCVLIALFVAHRKFTLIQVDKEGAVNMEDAAGFFANVFGGERFMDYVSGLLIVAFFWVQMTISEDRRNIYYERHDKSRYDYDD